MVLYQVDDLFDLVLTVDREKQVKMNKQVCIPFSSSGTLCFNWKISREIKSIRQQLDEINSDIAGLNLNAYRDHRGEPQSLRARFMRNRESGSHVKEYVTGRENDKKIITEMLFDPKFDGKRITVIPIVGFGGLGKTTLAQLVFNDEGVQNHFDLTKWVCVPEVGDQNTVIRRVYQCFTGKDDFDRLLFSAIESCILESVEGKKYLLVLDDVWDESWNRWLDLLSLLECGATGSRVIVTTRSADVAKAVGTTEAHNLGLLTEEESWNLFKKLAFRSEQEESNNSYLTQLGKEIVDSCGNVPLAIKVVGSLLPDISEEEWRQIRDARLSKAKGKEDGIMQVLKLSYDYLPPALKQCFSYCSLFPKDYEYSKNHMVKLWMAQGYFEQSSTGIGEKYFMKLLGRSLFQGPREDAEGNFKCKMHDLVHDLAQDIASEEMKQLVEPLDQISSTDELIHVSAKLEKLEDGEWEAPVSLLAARRIRSLILLRFNVNIAIKSSSLEMMVLKFQSLRVLDLEGKKISVVPNSIGKLRHLRYLNLARNDLIKCLPDNITRLQNLQTLNLLRCFNLRELPRDFCKLDSLRHLEILYSGLRDFPTGFANMTALKELDVFIVGKNNGIDSLPPLNISENVDFEFSKWRSDAVVEAQRANLKDNTHLVRLKLMFGSMEVTPADFGELDRMLMSLQLPPNLKNIFVQQYKGVEMPRRWLDGLSKLVFIRIEYCRNCRVLPHMSRLPHLKELYLSSIDSLEYVEYEDDISVCDVYYPSLEDLQLLGLMSLKGWTRPSKGDNDGEPRQLLFPRLLKMKLITSPS
ncbi:putative disease resistance protein RGA3 [Chenopodium quinoa]|nr:putative disease resistance protein RGA3 [Chenopodium quinoa]